MDKKEVLLLGGGAAALLVVATVFGKQQGSNVVFGQANPQSVAAIENANVSEAQNLAQASNDRIKTIADAITSLAQTQATVNAAQLDYQKTIAEVDAATTQVGLQTSAQVQINSNTNQTDLARTQNQDAAAQQVAATVAAANQAIAQTDANAAQAVGVAGANATAEVGTANANANAAAAADAASAQKTASNDGLWGSIIGTIGSVLSFFNPASGGNPTASAYPTDNTPAAQAINQTPDLNTSGIPVVTFGG